MAPVVLRTWKLLIGSYLTIAFHHILHKCFPIFGYSIMFHGHLESIVVFFYHPSMVSFTSS